MKPRTEFISVQYLRALAASLVVFYHATEQFAGFEAALPRQYGAAGVDLFFVISGFIMVAITDARPTTAPMFLMRRALRIWPIYAVYTTVTAVAILLAPALFRDSIVTAKHYLLSLAFMVHPDPLDPTIVSPMLKIGWTLNFEMFFYVLFALCLWLGGRRKVALLGAIMALLVVAGQVRHPDVVPAFYTDPIILEFLFGAAIGVWFTRPKSRVPSNAAALGLIALGAGLCVLLPMELDRAVHSGIGCALILVGALTLERNGAVGTWRLPRLVGDASYSLYLTHLYTVVALRTIWLKFHLPTGGVSATLIFLAISLAGAIAVGIASFWLLERPMMAWSHRFVASLQPRRTAEAAHAG